MKVAILVVLVASFALGQNATTNACTPSQQLTVKDPTEYDAYVKVTQTLNPADKIQVAERFLYQYPKSVVKAGTLKLLLLAYQQLRNEDEAVRTAERLLESEPGNLRALALLAYAYRDCANRNGANAKSCSDKAVKYAHQGLDSLDKAACTPAGMSAEEFNQLKTQVRPIFEQAAQLEKPNKGKPR